MELPVIRERAKISCWVRIIIILPQLIGFLPITFGVSELKIVDVIGCTTSANRNNMVNFASHWGIRRSIHVDGIAT